MEMTNLHYQRDLGLEFFVFLLGIERWTGSDDVHIQ